VGVFLCLAVAVLVLSALTLAVAGTPLDVIWTGQQAKRSGLAALGWPLIVGFLALAAGIVALAAGWFRRRRWAWWLTVVGIAVNMVGDVTQILTGHIWEGLTGVAGAGAVLCYLCTRGLRAQLPY